jgi:phage gpG-like protein
MAAYTLDNAIIYDDSELRRKISLAISKLSNTQEFYNNIGIQVSEDIISHFDREEGRGGVRWQALKKRQGKILQDTGAMRKITHVANKDGVLVGTTVNYGVYHNFGNSKLPKREWLYISDRGKQKLEKLIDIYIAGSFDKAGFGRA